MTTLEIIRQITAEKTASRRAPAHALRLEIMARFDGSREQLDAELAELEDFFVIISHNTINDVSYEITGL